MDIHIHIKSYAFSSAVMSWFYATERCQKLNFWGPLRKNKLRVMTHMTYVSSCIDVPNSHWFLLMKKLGLKLPLKNNSYQSLAQTYVCWKEIIDWFSSCFPHLKLIKKHVFQPLQDGCDGRWFAKGEETWWETHDRKGHLEPCSQGPIYKSSVLTQSYMCRLFIPWKHGHNQHIGHVMFEGSLKAKLPTVWRDGNGTARKKLGRGESQHGEDKGWRR